MKIFVRQALMVFVGLFLAGTALVSSSCKSVSPAKDETVSIHKGKSVKEIVKTFDVKGRACVLADNLYGSVNVSYWNENKVEFRVVIEVDAASEKKKSEMLNSITIDFDESQKLVNGKSMSCFSGKTRFSKSYSCRNCQTSIRYYICVPYNLENLSLKQKYGNVVIDADEINAETELSVMYGGIKAGNFKKPLSVVSSYSEIHIGSMAEKSEMKLQYCSSVKLGDSDRQLVLDAAYSDIDLGYIDHFTGNVIYGDLTMKGVRKQIGMDIKYGDVKIERIDGLRTDNQIDVYYGDLRIGYFSNKSGSWTLRSFYSDMKIGIPRNECFELNMMKVGSYSDVSLDGFEDVWSKGLPEGGKNLPKSYFVNCSGHKDRKADWRIDFDGVHYGDLRIKAL